MAKAQAGKVQKAFKTLWSDVQEQTGGRSGSIRSLPDGVGLAAKGSPRGIIHGVIDSAIRLSVDTVPEQMMLELKAALTIPNPEFAKRKKMGLWLGNTPKAVSHYRIHDGNELEIPAGYLAHLHALAERHGSALRFHPWGHRWKKLNYKAKFSPRPYQAKAVAEAWKKGSGILVAPCGAGKTVMGAMLVEMAAMPALVLVHTKELAAQWKQALGNVGLMGGGKSLIKPITVAMVQTLNRAPMDTMLAFLERFGLLIVDECHHTPATTYRKIVHLSPAVWKIGLTATPDRADGLGSITGLYLGPELARITHDDLKSAGVLVTPRVECISTGFCYDYNRSISGDYTRLVGRLVADDDRNKLIIDQVAADASAGHKCLVLSCRKAHVAHLADRLAAMGITASWVCSSTPKRQRASIIAAMGAGCIDVLLATQLADEGLDLPTLDRCYLVAPTRAAGRTVQRVGRIMRAHWGKGQPVVYDYVDRRVGILLNQHYARRRAYRAMGADVGSM